jgi:hypothetical protein
MDNDDILGGISMRTTLTIDDKTFSLLKEAANQSGKPFKQVINEVLLLGLDQLDKPKSQPYHLKAASLGKARHGIDLNKALYLADYLEDMGIAAKLEQRK